MSLIWRVGKQELDDWVEDFADDTDLDSQTPVSPTQNLRVLRIRPGWPFLQLTALKECIKVAEHEKGEIYSTLTG